RVVRIIDRLNIGGPAKHVTWLSSGLSGDEFETVLITGVVPPGEGDMGYFAHAAGVEPIVIKEMSRELGPRDVLVIAKLVRMFFRLRPQIIHTHKSKAGAAGRVAATIYKWMTPSALWLRPRDCKIVHLSRAHFSQLLRRAQDAPFYFHRARTGAALHRPDHYDQRSAAPRDQRDVRRRAGRAVPRDPAGD